MAEPHAAARRGLRSAVRAGRLPRSLLFTGEEGIGKLALAEWLVRLRWCQAADPPCGSCPTCRKVMTGNHPDHLVVRRGIDPAALPGAAGSRHEITVDQVRQEILPLLALRAVEGRGRAVVLAGAEDLNVEAQNALLKVLEEPPPESLLVLVTSREEALLDTIRSRCQEVRLFAEDGADGSADGAAGSTQPASTSAGAGAEVSASEEPQAGELSPDARVEAVVEALDLLLQGRLRASDFAQRLTTLAGGESSTDVDRARTVLLSLQRRVRDLALLAAGAGAQRRLTPQPVAQPLPPTVEVLLAVGALVMEASQDLQRHMPGHVVWLALGRGIAAAAVGGAACTDR